MDFNLHCNALECRAALSQLAVVTTCSHIFCSSCADDLLIKHATAARHTGAVVPTCPACQAELKNPDDIVKTNLNPSDDYKTSVLSGLSPNLILEIAGRGISFWMYQTTQEVVYQEYLAKTLADKFNTISVQLDKVILEANTEINAVKDKLQALTLENDRLARKNHELNENLRDKTRKQQQTQEAYEKLKRKQLFVQMHTAANKSVDKALANQHAQPDTSGGGMARQLSELTSGRLGSRLGDEQVMGNVENEGLPRSRLGLGSRMEQNSFDGSRRLTLPMNSGSGHSYREESISDMNSESGRQNATRVPTHGKVGTANPGPWGQSFSLRDNVNMVPTATPMNSQNHRQRLGPFKNGKDQGPQAWNKPVQKLTMSGPIPINGRMVDINELSKHAVIGRPTPIAGMQHHSRNTITRGGTPGGRSIMTPQNRQFGTAMGEGGGGARNGMYFG